MGTDTPGHFGSHSRLAAFSRDTIELLVYRFNAAHECIFLEKKTLKTLILFLQSSFLGSIA